MTCCNKKCKDAVKEPAKDTVAHIDENENASDTGAPSHDNPSDRIAQLEAELSSVQGQYIRAFAEMDNIQKRAQREKEDAARFGASSLAKDIVIFVDNLERALKNIPNVGGNNEFKSFVDGVEMISRDITKTLEKHGILKIDSDGQTFDPDLHQVVSEVPANDKETGVVFETLQTGYTINGRLLRAAIVAVTK
ncbi:MAG: nucleotide exchange factor GrpE [Holosporales bacterium]|jgi:molecular chaperone GrpE|nr:nucleotide exchange factor GrpE [Holosporales bacterium]